MSGVDSGLVKSVSRGLMTWLMVGTGFESREICKFPLVYFGLGRIASVAGRVSYWNLTAKTKIS